MEHVPYSPPATMQFVDVRGTSFNLLEPMYTPISISQVYPTATLLEIAKTLYKTSISLSDASPFFISIEFLLTVLQLE
jgi:hypothetical protein